MRSAARCGGGGSRADKALREGLYPRPEHREEEALPARKAASLQGRGSTTMGTGFARRWALSSHHGDLQSQGHAGLAANKVGDVEGGSLVGEHPQGVGVCAQFMQISEKAKLVPFVGRVA